MHSRYEIERIELQNGECFYKVYLKDSFKQHVIKILLILLFPILALTFPIWGLILKFSGKDIVLELTETYDTLFESKARIDICDSLDEAKESIKEDIEYRESSKPEIEQHKVIKKTKIYLSPFFWQTLSTKN